MLFLSPEQLQAVAQKLSDEGIRQSVERNRTLLQTPQSFALKQLVQYDPFNLAPIFLEKFQAAGGGFHIDASSGYYLSSDHTMLLILARPRHPAQDVPFAKGLLEDGAAIEAQALADFRKSNPNAALPQHRAHRRLSDRGRRRGPHPRRRHHQHPRLFLRRSRDCSSTPSAVPSRFSTARCRWRLALLMTFGIAGTVYGQLSSASAGFAALLAGLGIDFITVLYGRYVDERNRGATMSHGLVIAMRSSLPGIAVAALTTAATFYAFLATDFRGMTQLGFLTGTGVLFFLLCTALVLPALIVISERHGEKKAPKLYLHSFGSEKLIGASLRNPRATIWIWIVFIAFCGIFATRLRFSDNIQDLRAKGNTGVVNQEKVTKKFGQSFEFMMYVDRRKVTAGCHHAHARGGE